VCTHRALTAPLVAIALVLADFVATAPAGTQHSRDRLWTLIQSCLVPGGNHNTDTCQAPRADGIGNLDPRCMTTTQVWAQSQQYVAIRDERMCNCPAGFVHGLAIPFARISGIEADNLPEGIWKFAWDAARGQIADAAAIALVVSPPLQRTQDQLHIHLVRRRAGACATFPADALVSTTSLNHIWRIVQRRAKRGHFTNYSVLVTKCAKDRFTVVVEEVPKGSRKTPEGQYTEHDCR